MGDAAYRLVWAGDGARAAFDGLMARATGAGKRGEFVYWFGELVRRLTDPRTAMSDSDPLGPSAIPGGFLRKQSRGRVALEYVVFPDEEVVIIHHIGFVPSDWA